MKDNALKLIFNFLKSYMTFRNNLTFFRETMQLEIIKKLVNFHYKKENVIHIRNLKYALSHGLLLKKLQKSLVLMKKFD